MGLALAAVRRAFWAIWISLLIAAPVAAQESQDTVTYPQNGHPVATYTEDPSLLDPEQ